MAMQGTVAYLLQQRPAAPTGKILVVDLHLPDMPRELARVEVSDKAASLFFINSQLVVYSTKRGMAGHQEVALYDVVENHRLRLYDRGESPNLGQHFLQYEDYLLVAGSGGGLEVYDFSHPLKPERVAFLKTTVLNRLAGSGSMVFATGLGGRLYSFDFRNPLQPVVSTVVDKVDQPAYFLEYDNYSYFFTSNCYLNVFDFSPANSELPEQSSLMVQGELVSLAHSGFTLLGQPPASLPSPVTGVLPWPESSKVVDHLVWQDSLVVLDEKGLLSFYRQAEDSSLVFLYTLPLASPQRWLAAFGDYLYAGGQGHITLLAANDDELVSVSGQVDLPGKETWDGLVLKETLYVAAGKDGLLAYSLRRPGTPVATSGWIAPRYLRSEVDVRHLAAADDGRILFTAGPAGFFSGRMQAGREFRLEGSFRFTTSTIANAAHDGLALVSTGRDVSVVDIRDSHSFQNLGKIAFPGVKKFALASSDQFAGYSAATGWSFLPLPHFLANGEEHSLNKSLPPHTDRDVYRLHVFNDRDVKIASGLFLAPDGLINQSDAGGDLVR